MVSVNLIKRSRFAAETQTPQKDNSSCTHFRVRQRRNHLMNKAQQKRYHSLYQKHLNALKRPHQWGQTRSI